MFKISVKSIRGWNYRKKLTLLHLRHELSVQLPEPTPTHHKRENGKHPGHQAAVERDARNDRRQSAGKRQRSRKAKDSTAQRLVVYGK